MEEKKHKKKRGEPNKKKETQGVPKKTEQGRERVDEKNKEGRLRKSNNKEGRLKDQMQEFFYEEEIKARKFERQVGLLQDMLIMIC